MNSLNSDVASSTLNQSKYRPIDVSNQYYQPNVFFGLPNSANLSPEFASLQNAYGANQLLATQFSFQYSDSQGLGEGGGAGGPWGASASQSRASGGSMEHPGGHFYSLPSHGHAQTADQNLFYPYGFSTTNNVYWPHASVLEYKSNNQNYSIPATDKGQNWPESITNNQQYSPLNNSLNYKSNIPSIDHNILAVNNPQSNYELQLGSNGYQIAQVAGKVLTEDMHSLNDDRSSFRKTENSNNQEIAYSSSNNANNRSHDMNSLQSQMAKSCSLNNDNNNSSISQHPYSTQSFVKQTLNNNNNNNNITTDFWSNDVNKISSSNVTKSYAKAAKLPSRSVTHLSNSSYYLDNNNYNGTASRTNYKSTTNGFATGFSRPSNGNNNWCNNALTNGTNWNSTKPKWSSEVSRSQPTQPVSDPSSKSSWTPKVPLSNPDEHLRNAEYKIKEIQLQINPKRLEINFEKTRYFVIKSYSEDDVHRSIKYKIWCSTKEGNRRLNEAFLGAQKIGGTILLFFSVNGSGHFCGVAEMISPVDESVVTGVWCQDKWRGKFSVKWLFVKDVPNTQLRHISTKVKIQKVNGETTNEVKPITNLRDATELKSEKVVGSTYKDDIGYNALKIIMDCKSTMSIFDDFLHYEKRELGIESAN